MKRMLWAVLLASTVSFGVVQAQMGGDEGGMEGDNEADENNAAIKAQFNKLDADSDGKITKEEMKAALGDEAENMQSWFQTYAQFLIIDSNDDGSISLEELTAANSEDFDGKASDDDIAKLADELLSMVDGDKDGNITLDELNKADPEETEENAEEFKEMDSDSDGKVTKDELKEAIKKAFEGEAPDDKEEPKEAGATGDDDPYALYKKEGRSWTIKSTSKMAGTEMVSYMKTEVKSVADDHAVVIYTSMDKDKKEYPGVKPSEMKVQFAAAGSSEAPKGTPKPEVSDETIKVEAGEFECKKSVLEVNGIVHTTWMSKQYPGLMVKHTSVGEQMDNTSELVEFNDGK